LNQLTDPLYLALKAAFACAAAVLLVRWLGGTDLLSAGFVALLCTSPSAHAGLRRGLQQAAGSLLGALIAGGPQLLHPELRGNPGALAVSMAAALLASFRLRLGAAYPVTGFTVLYFHVLPFPSFGVALQTRMLAVITGIATATLVNLAVASLRGEYIVERRLRMARQAVASSLRTLARRPTEEGGSWPDFEGAFSAIAELRQDLGALSAERLFPGAARSRSSAREGLRQAVALEDAAHLGKELALLLSRRPPHDARVASWLEQAAGSLEDAPTRTGIAPPTTDDLVLDSALRRLQETLSAALRP
jgi:uncharacterized membrane protein YgaE (UPF0421/DUF939 family)